MRITKNWVRRSAALVAIGAAALFTAAPAASATSAAENNCSASFVEWDPDEGNGAGWSRCWTPYMTEFHRVYLFCYYGGDQVGDWARPWEESSTTCLDGSGAYGAQLQT